MAKKGFNWSGITDNGDGSFTAKSKIEKKRLLKSLHTSGYKVRSKRNTDGSWVVTTVGTMRPKRTSQTSHGYRPAVRAAREYPVTRSAGPKGRYVPIRGRYVPLRRRKVIGPAPRPMYPGAGAGSYRRPGEPLSGKLARWQKERMARKQKQQAENPSEISKRVAAQEQKGTVSIKEQVTAFQEGRKPHPSDESAQDTWDRERKERAEAESKRQRELGESAMQREKQQKAINRGIIHRTSQGVPNEPEPPKEGIFGVRKTSDIDQSALQRAREESVTGE